MRNFCRWRFFVRTLLIGVLILLTVYFVGRHSLGRYNMYTYDLEREVSPSWRNSSLTNSLIDDTISNSLLTSYRLLCFVMTIRENEETKARAVIHTWGKRCTKLVFVTTYQSAILDSLVVDVPEGRAHLTAKTMKALHHLYEHYRNDYDYFIKADDDTYIIVENLQLLLTKFDPDEPVYLGFHFRFNVGQGYMSGGGSYVISRKALHMVVNDGIKVGGVCAEDGPDEDVDVALCLEKVGVAPYVTHDQFGRHSFHVTDVKASIIGPLPDYLREYPTHPVNVGPNCCSQFSISFHYTKPEMMYVMEFLLYRVSVHGWNVDYHALDTDDMFMKKKSLVKHAYKGEILYYKVKKNNKPFMPV